jgi:hypothetical protein
MGKTNVEDGDDLPSTSKRSDKKSKMFDLSTTFFYFGFLLQTTVCIERESVTGWRSFLLPALTKNVLLVHKGQI